MTEPLAVPLLVPPGAGTGGGGGSPAAQPTAPSLEPIVGHNSMTGWNHFQRAVATGMPTSLHRVAVLQRATLRLLPSGRKVAR